MSRITDAELDQMAFEADPTADDVVADHAAERPEASPRDLVAGIARHLVLPPERGSAAITAYLAEQPPLPDWHQPKLLEQGATFFQQNALEIAAALFCASLPEAYAGHRGSRVLTLTARFVTDPVRRVNETAQLIVNVLSPGGLEPGVGHGYRDARRVRLMHAAVRYLILNDPDVAKTDDPGAGPESWPSGRGVPVCQEDLLATLLTFTTVPLATLDRLGIGFTAEAAEAYMHTWCVVGHLLGLSCPLPISVKEAKDLQVRLMTKLQGPSPDAAVLGRALNQAMIDSLMVPPLTDLPAALITYFCGRDIAAINGLHSDWLMLGFEPLHLFLRLLGLAERHNVIVSRLAREMTGVLLGEFLQANRPGRPGFALPDELATRVRPIHARWRI
jgi:ER-bound oxygenase mpaB/B'/Rubber oxygenase, catalytic domain